MTALPDDTKAKLTAIAGGREDGKLTLPPIPEHDDHAGLCRWITVAFNLDPRHPIRDGRRDGDAGPRGHAVLLRVEAPEIRFEPITQLGEPRSLIPVLSSYKLPTDGIVHDLKAAHCRQVFHVVTMLCAIGTATTAEQETWGIVGDLLLIGEAVGGFTLRGTVAQRYEAAGELRRGPDGRPRYLVDEQTGEVAVMASEMQAIARRHVGATMSHGWLDARIAGIGWERVLLDAWERPGRAGRRGDHRRCVVYRGAPSSGGVTT